MKKGEGMTLAFGFSGSALRPAQQADGAVRHTATYEGTHIPKDNCQIRAWYNYQVVAIPKLNEYWIEQYEEAERKPKTKRHITNGNDEIVPQNQIAHDRFEEALSRHRPG